MTPGQSRWLASQLAGQATSRRHAYESAARQTHLGEAAARLATAHEKAMRVYQ